MKNEAGARARLDAKELFDKVNKAVMDALKQQEEYERSPQRIFDEQYELLGSGGGED